MRARIWMWVCDNHPKYIKICLWVLYTRSQIGIAYRHHKYKKLPTEELIRRIKLKINQASEK